MSFVHLHTHTEYSLLDGFSKIKKLVARTKEMGMPAAAITDHGTMFGVIEFYRAAKDAGIKPVIGVESYMAAKDMHVHDISEKKSSHLLLLAENDTGYKNLLKIASASQLEGYYYYPRVDHAYMEEHAEGLICTSGCMAAEIPQLIMRNDIDGARKRIDWYYSVFGKDNFFFELQDHDIPELRQINKTLLDLGKEYDARFVATNDAHYVDAGDWRYQDIMLAIQTGARLNDEKRMRMSGKTYYIRSPQEMTQLFGNVPGAIENTLLIAERCNVDLDPTGYHLPLFEVPEGETTQSYLRKLCETGLAERYGERVNDADVRERFEKELRIIHDMGFDAYFLIVWDLCEYARSQNIWYNVRGSGAGSMVAYSLHITPVEPLEFKLIFERFLNPGRVSMPDIDLDFQDDKRYKMLEYCSLKYGADKVSQIITFNTLGAKGAVRDVGRVMDIGLSEVDRICKLIPPGIKMPQSGNPITLNTCLAEVPEFAAAVEEKPELKELVSTAAEMEGVVRNAGTHAAGVIITDVPTVEYAPMHRPTSGSDENPIKSVAQFEMTYVDIMGLLKVDFLGLATLTIMQRCCDMIKERHGVDLNLTTIPTDDIATFDFLGEGNTAGVFQLESPGMTRNIIDMKPHNLAHIIAMVALYRPGPMQFIPDYIACLRGEKQPFYRHELLKPIFEETYGIPVYQEQIMFAAMDLANYSASEADDLRKAISKKKKAKVEEHRQKFISGSVANGVSTDVAEAIFKDWEQFANYGFNKSHAADYGVLAVQTGYLKCHYMIEYMSATLTSNRQDSDKVAFYINDCRSAGISVLPPTIESSMWDFSVEDTADGKGQIRFGMGAVKNVGQSAAEALIAERKNGPFRDLSDFVNRLDLRLVGKRALESLIKVGAMDSFGDRGSLLAGLDLMMNTSAANFREKESGQFGLFDLSTLPATQLKIPQVPSISQMEKLQWERELLGLFVSAHPLDDYKESLHRRHALTCEQAGEKDQGSHVCVGGLVSNMRVMLTKKDSRSMCSIKLEDVTGNVIDAVFFPKMWDKLQSVVQMDAPIIVEGMMEKSRGAPQIIVRNAESMKQSDASLAAANYADSYSAEMDNEWDKLQTDINDAPSPGIYYSGQDDDFGSQFISEAGAPPTEDFMLEDPFFASLCVAPAETNDTESKALPTVDQKAAEPVMPQKEDLAPATTRTSANPTVYLGDAEFVLEEDDDDDVAYSPKLLTLVITSENGNKGETNTRRLKRLHGLVTSYPGRDNFAFMIQEKGKINLVEFPDLKIDLSDELMDKLRAEVGEENIRVEK